MQRLQLKMQVWRNWQTRMVQVHMSASSCRFKSCHLHQEFVLLNELLLFLQDLNLSSSCHLQNGGRSFERPPLVLYNAGIPLALLPKALQPGLALCGPVPGGVGLLLGGKDAVGHPFHLAEDPLPKSRALAQDVRWTSSPLRTTWAVTLPPMRISSSMLSSSSPPAGSLLFWNCTRERKACQGWGYRLIFPVKNPL